MTLTWWRTCDRCYVQGNAFPSTWQTVAGKELLLPGHLCANCYAATWHEAAYTDADAHDERARYHGDPVHAIRVVDVPHMLQHANAYLMRTGQIGLHYAVNRLDVPDSQQYRCCTCHLHHVTLYLKSTLKSDFHRRKRTVQQVRKEEGVYFMWITQNATGERVYRLGMLDVDPDEEEDKPLAAPPDEYQANVLQGDCVCQPATLPAERGAVSSGHG